MPIVADFAVSESVNNPCILPRRQMINHTLAGTLAASGGNYNVFFTLPGTEIPTAAAAKDLYEVVAIRYRYSAAGNDAGAVSFDIVKVPSGSAVFSGAPLTAATNNLKATANVAYAPALTAVVADRRLKAGDGLGLIATGTLTSLANLSVTVELRRIGVQY